MADNLTFTQKVDKFFDNNTPGGYIQTTVNISDNDLSTRIEQAVRNQGFLTSTSHIPWSQVDNKPTFFSGNYADLSGKPTKLSQFTNDLPSQHIPTINVSNTLASGDLLATITIDGINTNIYGNNGNNNSGIIEEDDPIFLSSPAASITNEDIENLTTLSNNVDNLLVLNEKAKIIYINVEQSPYSYTNFGAVSFFNSDDQLINDICAQLDQNKIIILVSSSGNWIINRYTINNNLNTKFISLNFISHEQYFDILEDATNLIIKNENETDEEYTNRFNSYIVNNLTLPTAYGLLIRDNNLECSYFKFIKRDLQLTLANLNSRITALEEAI